MELYMYLEPNGKCVFLLLDGLNKSVKNWREKISGKHKYTVASGCMIIGHL